MNKRFWHLFKFVTLAHVVVLVLVLGGSWFHGCFRTPADPVVPIEFVFDVSEDVSLDELLEPIVPEIEAEDLPIPEPEPEPRKKEEKTIDVSRQKVVREAEKKPGKKLSPEEIRKLLARGAERGDHNSVVPEDDAWGKELIRRALYAPYNPPSAAEVGGALPPKVKIRLERDGSVADSELVRRSGHSEWDEAAMSAVRSVTRIRGLTSTFLVRHRELTIAFEVGE